MKQTFFLFVIVLFVFSCSKSNLENEQYDESTDFPDNEGAIIDPLNSGGAYLQWDDSYLFHSPLDQLNLIFGFGLKNPEFNNQYHLGQDLLTSQFSSVYSIADGKIVFKNFYPNHSSKKHEKLCDY